MDGRTDHMVHTCLSCSCVGYREEYTHNFIEIPIQFVEMIVEFICFRQKQLKIY